MAPLAYWLDDCLLPLFVLTTVLLAIGCGLMGLTRSPAHRQRTGELTLVAIFGWWILACLPLPRLVPERLWTRSYFRALVPVPEAMSTFDHHRPAPPINEPQPGTLGVSEAGQTFLETRQMPVWEHGTASAAPLEHALIGRPVRDADSLADDLPPAGGVHSRITVGYLAGVAACVLWLACGQIRLARIRRAARRPPAWLAQMFAELVEGTGERPVLLVSRHSSRPISWGAWRPTIVLPLALVRRRHRGRLRMVLLHELAHVVRRDGWGNGLLCLALPLLYPHPLFLWLRAQVRLAAELLADDWAAQRGGKLAYVEQLVSLARSSAQSPAPLPLAGAVTLYSSSSQFYRRMQMLISRTCPLSVVPTARWRVSSLAVAALAAVTAASMAGARPAWSQQLPSADQAASQPEDPKNVPPSPLSADSAEAGAAKIVSEKDLSPVKIAAGEDQATLRMRLLRAEADLVVAKENLSRAEGLLRYSRRMHGKGYVTQSDVESKESALEKARLDLEVAELTKERLSTVDEAGTTEARESADEQALRARLAAAEERIRFLEAQLKGAGANPLAATPASGDTAPQPAITLTRVAEDGSISHEVWTTGADGRPEKLVAKAAGRPRESLIAAAKTSVLPDGRIMKQFTEKNGRATTRVYDPKGGTVTETYGSTTRVYDSKTGRLIEARSLADPAAAKAGDAAAQTKTGADPNVAIAEWSPEKPSTQPIGLGHASPSSGTTGTEIAGLDLVNLATAYADAVGAVEEAEAKMAAAAPDNDARPARAALRSARRKQELLRNLATVAADTARTDLERVQQLVRAGAASAESATAAESRWKMLNAIIESGPSGNADPKQPGQPPSP